MTDTRVARQMWTRFEPIHDVTYFTPEAAAAYEAAGLRGYWRGYFAGRAAPMGAVDATPVISAAYGFAPRMVTRALPEVWTRATPTEALRARSAGATAALERILAGCDGDTFTEIVTLAEAAVGLLEPAGRPFGSANAALPVDEDAPPLARLWQTTSTFREHRGDGHVAALLTYGFDGVESVVWRFTTEHRAELQQYRGWTDGEWDAAAGRLTERGWLDAGGAHTPEGDAVYAAVEQATDRAAARVWHALGSGRTERLRELLMPLAVVAYDCIPSVNPVRVPHPETLPA